MKVLRSCIVQVCYASSCIVFLLYEFMYRVYDMGREVYIGYKAEGNHHFFFKLFLCEGKLNFSCLIYQI